MSWVGVADVAALVERAVVDDALRGGVLEICGPEAMTLTRLAELIMAQHGWPGSPRHVPRAALQVMANTIGRLKPVLGLPARAALTMDELPTTDDTELRTEFPTSPVHLSLRWSQHSRRRSGTSDTTLVPFPHGHDPATDR